MEALIGLAAMGLGLWLACVVVVGLLRVTVAVLRAIWPLLLLGAIWFGFAAVGSGFWWVVGGGVLLWAIRRSNDSEQRPSAPTRSSTGTSYSRGYAGTLPSNASSAPVLLPPPERPLWDAPWHASISPVTFDGQKVRYDLNGRASHIGNDQVHYDLNGNPVRVGNRDVHLPLSGPPTIGGTPIQTLTSKGNTPLFGNDFKGFGK